jgi:hypothetical protein
LLETVRIRSSRATAGNSPDLDCLRAQPVDPDKVQYNVGHEGMTLEEHTGAAKTSVPNKKKKGIYEERRIAVFLGGLDSMTVSAGEPELLYTELVFVWGTTCPQEILQE